MDRDGFWSIDKLIPRVSGASPFSFEKKNSGVLIQSLVAEESEAGFGPCITQKNSKVIRHYQLTKLSLPQNDLILKENAGETAKGFVPCTMFSPSILSLRPEQRNFFFSFCQSVSSRKKIETAFPYVQLYLCRLIRENLFSNPMPEEFFWVWSTYRSDFPIMDKLFSDTLSDFCLVGKTVPDYEKLSEIVCERDFTARPFILDLYIFDHLFKTEHKLSPREMNFVLRALTGESFRRSKAYHTNAIFAAASEEAVERALENGLFNREDLNASLFRIQIPSEVRTERKLFQGLPQEEVPSGLISLCYVPLLHDENIRSRVDEIIRYLENRIRKILKIKNSLSRIHVSLEHKNFLEGILLGFEHLAPKEDENSDERAPAYQAKADKHRELSVDFDAAAQIEEDSWGLTKTLTETYAQDVGESVVIGGASQDENFDNEYRDVLSKLETARAPQGAGDFWEFAGMLEETEDCFMRIAVNNGKEAARRFAVANGKFFEALIAICNSKAQEATDDSIFDGMGEVYEDYLESLKEVFPPMEGETP